MRKTLQIMSYMMIQTDLTALNQYRGERPNLIASKSTMLILSGISSELAIFGGYSPECSCSIMLRNLENLQRPGMLKI